MTNVPVSKDDDHESLQHNALLIATVVLKMLEHIFDSKVLIWFIACVTGLSGIALFRMTPEAISKYHPLKVILEDLPANLATPAWPWITACATLFAALIVSVGVAWQYRKLWLATRPAAKRVARKSSGRAKAK